MKPEMRSRERQSGKEWSGSGRENSYLKEAKETSEASWSLNTKPLRCIVKKVLESDSHVGQFLRSAAPYVVLATRRHEAAMKASIWTCRRKALRNKEQEERRAQVALLEHAGNGTQATR